MGGVGVEVNRSHSIIHSSSQHTPQRLSYRD
jgi:hypothetical protein